MSITISPTTEDRLGGLLVYPGDDGWDAARAAWNLVADQRPEAVAFPETTADVVAIVEYAGTRGLRVAPQGTGHNATAIASLDRAVLVKTSRMREVVIDPSTRTARIGAGALWEDVVTAAHEHGLAALAGSSPDVGAVGYTLGGGVSWLARTYGLSCNNVRSIDVVTANGRPVQASRNNEPELFWALRGGGGSFGIVTGMELDLFPITEVFAGAMFWPIERAAEVMHTWRQLTIGFPETMTSVARILQLPPLPDVPEPLRGRSFAVVEAVFLGGAGEGSRLVEPLRALGPEIDTLAVIPPTELMRLHMDPEQPVPALGGGQLLRGFPSEAVDALLTLAGPGTDSPLLTLEVRHIGGAARRPAAGHGALTALDGDFMTFGGGIPMTPELGVAIQSRLAALEYALAPWSSDTTYLNFVEHPADSSSFYPPETYRRLRAARRTYDPQELFLSNHPIPPAAS
jgi:FAD/FMN-containing dehydrogenase